MTGGPPVVVVLSGPSGAGKDALIERIHGRSSPERFAVPITMTTRQKRPGEVDGVDYLFVTSEEFRRRLDAGELLEHAEVYGHHYGVPRSGLREALELSGIRVSLVAERDSGEPIGFVWKLLNLFVRKARQGQ